MIYELYKISTNEPQNTKRDFGGITPPIISHKDLEWREYVAPPPLPLTSEDIRSGKKFERAQAVAAIKVTTAATNEFDGDEESQGRMARAIIGLNAAGPGATIPWVLADNSVIMVTAAELTEALVLAGQAQAAIWVIE